MEKEDVEEEEGEENGDSVSDPSDLSSGDDLVGDSLLSVGRSVKWHACGDLGQELVASSLD